jgi:hypothetical protein
LKWIGISAVKPQWLERTLTLSAAMLFDAKQLAGQKSQKLTRLKRRSLSIPYLNDIWHADDTSR